MIYDTCDNCRNCKDVIEDPMGNKYYLCGLDGDYISQEWALDQYIGCDAFEQKLDDHETKESSA